jgi:hypothetical protein
VNTDAVRTVRSELETQLAEVDDWEQTSVSTDFVA